MYQRKNRKTKGIIELRHDRDLHGVALWIDWYWCQCEHGKKTPKVTQKTNAVRDMAHPDRWCEECANIIAMKSKEEQ